MINRYALVLTAPAVMLSSGLASQAVASMTTIRHAERVPNATVGNEIHKAGSYFAVPPLDSVLVVQNGIDRGGDFSGPTDYPQERHVVYVPSEDTYFAFYEWNTANDFMISARYWQEVAGFGFWSAEGTPSERGTQQDAGRPSAHEYDGGVMVAYHATFDLNVYNTWINRFDFATQSWGTSVQITDHAVGSTFPFLDRSSDDTWMIVSQEGPGPVDIVVNISNDDGATWTQNTVATGVNDMWCLPSGAADPSNGDLYVAYNDDLDDDNDLDIVVHQSTDGGMTWSAPQMVADGAIYSQKIEPSLVVDQTHRVHLVYQGNISDEISAGLSGLTTIGVAGPPYHSYGAFVAGAWVPELTIPIMDRDELVALPDSCEMGPTLANLATDTLTGMPQLGIYRGMQGDQLYVGYNSSYQSIFDTEQGGWLICGPGFQTWMQKCEVGADEADTLVWSERTMVSDISIDDALLGKNTIYTHTTHEIPLAGPGFIWSEMFEALQPAEVMFNRPEVVGIEGDRPGAPTAPGKVALHQNAPNPFNPSTRIGFELAEAGSVELNVYDASGRKVRSLAQGEMSAGSHKVRWDGTTDQGATVASGVYFYRLTTQSETQTRSMLILK